MLISPRDPGNSAFSQAQSDSVPPAKSARASHNKSLKELVARLIYYSGAQECREKNIYLGETQAQSQDGNLHHIESSTSGSL